MLIYSESNVCFRSKDIDHHRPKHCSFWSFFPWGVMGHGERDRGVQERAASRPAGGLTAPRWREPGWEGWAACGWGEAGSLAWQSLNGGSAPAGNQGLLSAVVAPARSPDPEDFLLLPHSPVAIHLHVQLAASLLHLPTRLFSVPCPDPQWASCDSGSFHFSKAGVEMAGETAYPGQGRVVSPLLWR